MAHQPPSIRPRKTKKHAKYAFVWPKDGKRTSKLGRWLDILTNRGPDIHIALHRGYENGENLGWNVPTRAQWSRWAMADDYDDEETDLQAYNMPGAPPVWARRGAAQKYDFRTRKWGDVHLGMWSDVVWEPGARHRDTMPRGWKMADGTWWTPRMYWHAHGP